MTDPVVPDIEVDVPSPLADCFLHCEVECVRECCGIGAITTDAARIADWARSAGPAAVAQALQQLEALVTTAEDRSHKVLSLFLNHYTCDETGRGELLSFLQAFKAGLLGASCST